MTDRGAGSMARIDAGLGRQWQEMFAQTFKQRVARGRERSDEAVGFIDEAIEVARRSGSHELLSSLTSTRRGWVS